MANVDSRQIIYRSALQQLSPYSTTQTLDNLLASINSDISRPLRVDAANPASRVLTVSNSTVSNAISNRQQVMPYVNSLLSTFAGGLYTFPASSGGNISASTGGTTVLTLASGNFCKVLLSLDSTGNLISTVGTGAGSSAAAVAPAPPGGVIPFAYVVVQNVAGTIANITQSNIFQFTSLTPNTDVIVAASLKVTGSLSKVVSSGSGVETVVLQLLDAGNSPVGSVRSFNGGGTNQLLRFYTETSGGAEVKALELDSSQNAIVTGSITANAGSSVFGATSAAALAAQFKSTNANGVDIKFTNNVTDLGFIGSAKSVVSGGFYTSILGDMAIAASGAGSQLILGTADTARIVINTTGDVGIGAAASARLHVDSAATSLNSIFNSTAAIGVRSQWYNSSASVGAIGAGTAVFNANFYTPVLADFGITTIGAHNLVLGTDNNASIVINSAGAINFGLAGMTFSGGTYPLVGAVIPDTVDFGYTVRASAALTNANVFQVQNSSAINLFSVKGSDGSVTIPNLAGVGTRTVTVSAAGKLTTGAASYTAPTIQKFTVTGTRSGFVISVVSALSSNLVAGAVYTNAGSGNSFTALNSVSSGGTGPIFWSGAGTYSGGTMNLVSGTGPATIVYVTANAFDLATYTTAPGALYLRVRMWAGGGGGGGSGTTVTTGSTSGTLSAFGAPLLIANGGGRSLGSVSGAGGTTTVGAGASGINLTGTAGGPFTNPSTAAGLQGGAGGSNGGMGYHTAATAERAVGDNASPNSGSGGAGGGGSAVTTIQSGSGGGGGGFIDVIVPSPSATYFYCIGTGGTGGAAGTSGFAGGNGAAGQIEVTEHYQ